MGKSRQGGVFGYLRGKVGSVSYSVQKSENSSSGKTVQVVRALPESVKNPQTASQTMQRMKLAPAQKFYSAFAQLLSNAFEGVAYGNASRQYFMSLAMAQNGPYVQRGVDRFLPANYPFSRGSLPTVAIAPFDGGTNVIKLEAITEAANPTNADLANALGVPVDTQITIAVVNNINGVFVPSHIGYDDRLTIEQLPGGFLTVDNTKLVLNPAVLGLDMSAMVACCVVLSRQDASGAWLRSTQDMVISNEMYQSLYSPEALQIALASYQDTKSANSINNEWYYNLGLNQAFNGQVTTLSVNLTGGAVSLLVGVQQQNGVVKYTIFATSTDDDGKVVGVIGQTATTELDNGQPYLVSEVLEAYPAFSVALYTPAIAQQAGKDNGVNTGGAPGLYYRTINTQLLVVDRQGRACRISDTAEFCINYTLGGDIQSRSQTGLPEGWEFSDVILDMGSDTTWNVNGTTYQFTGGSGQGTVSPELTEYPG